MMYWNYIISCSCFLLLLILVWKEVRRANKSWLPARVLATVLAVAGLAGIGLPLSYQQKQNRSTAKVAILLTEDYNKDSLTAFLKANTLTPVFTTEKPYASANIQYIADVHFFKKQVAEYSVIHLFGNGLEEDEQSTLQDIPVVFHSTPITKGITSISWNQQVKSGDPLRVQGHFQNDNAAIAKITLHGFSAGLDSILIPPGESKDFELSTIPMHLDKAVYGITVLSRTDTLENEPLPVQVISTNPIKILLLASAPDFENKFVKNWLAENKYGVVARTRITTNKFNKDYLNTPEIGVDRISTSVLNSFDVVFADATELSALTPSELAAIYSAVDQQGMGLIVKVDSSIRSGSFYSAAFPLMQVKDNLIHQTKLQYADNSTSQPSHLKIDHPIYILQQPGTQPLIRNDQSDILVSSKIQGLGRMIITTINNTYTWQLAGHAQEYSSFWTFLLQKVAKKKEQEENFAVIPFLPVVNEKATLQLQTSIQEAPQVLAGAAIINMEQNYQLPFLWQGYYWPQQSGWIPLLNRQKTINWIYAFDKNDWKNVRSEIKKSNTRKFAASHIDPSSTSAFTEKLVPTEIPKTYFFIVFLLAATFLWFEKKFKNG